MLKQFLNSCSLQKGLMLEKGYIPWKRPCTGARKVQEEEGAAETMSCQLTATPILHPSELLRRKVEEVAEAGPGEKGGVGRKRFQFCFRFSLSYGIFYWQKIKFIFPNQGGFAHYAHW